MDEGARYFKKQFGETAVHAVKVPGRVELLGNHTDYNQGLVMSLAVDRYLSMACSPRHDGRVELVSSAFPGRDRFWADRIEKNPEAPWADYIKGVLDQLRKRRVHFSGFNAAVHGTIPLGAGLSSSAALQVATALAVRRMFPYALSQTGLLTPPRKDRRGGLPPLTKPEKLALARLCQDSENQFVGVACGILDYVSCLCGAAQQVIELDCQSLEVTWKPLPGGLVVIICDSGVKHELATGEYNDRRAQCEAAAQALGMKSLRGVDPKDLPRLRSRLTESQYECVRHVVGENQRVQIGARALETGDIEQFGQYLYQSHESSRDYFRNSCRELDLLVDLAKRIPGCIGARLTGGGFGGATVNLVEHVHAEEFMQRMAAGYREKSGREMKPILCQVVGLGQ